MTADLLIYNADIVTMDPLLPRATALAIREGRVVALGEEADLRPRFAGATRQLDAGGRQILPGLQDLHIHLQDSGYYTGTMADLYGCRTEADMARALGDFAASHDRDWVFGVGFYCGLFSDANLDREVLDRMVPDRPVLIYGSDLHSACLNSRGCELLGMTAESPDPYNGHFTRRADGTPTGMLHEQALYWAKDRIGEIPDSDYRFGVRHAQALCHEVGITGIIDPMVQPRHARVYQSMVEDGTLKLRVGGAIHVTADETLPQAMERALQMRADHDSPLFRLHSVKMFLDGVLENRTAAMLKDYADAEGGNAPLMFATDQLKELCIAFDAARFQLHMHVIGDAAVRAGLDALEAAMHANGAWPSLHQMTHLEYVRPEDIPRLGQLGGVANIQALWARREPSVTEVAMPMAGPELEDWIYPFASLLEAGALGVLTSDWGVSSQNPFWIMQTAITRQPTDAPDYPPLTPSQRLTREQALKAYTVNAARAAWRPDTGALSVGNLADLIIINQDLLACDVHDIAKTQVLLTLLGGEEVFRAEGFPT